MARLTRQQRHEWHEERDRGRAALRRAFETPPPMQHPPRREAAPVVPQAPTPPQSQPANANISINIHVPELHIAARFKKAWRGVSRVISRPAKALAGFVRGHKAISSMLAVVLVLGLLAALVGSRLLRHGGTDVAGSGSAGGSSAGARAPARSKPSFSVVVPNSKPQLASTDNKKAGYDGSRDVYSYQDNVGNNAFIVSEQPIPAGFDSGSQAVDKIAPTVGSGATEAKITTQHGNAYVITSTAEAGGQTVVASNGKVLIFIRSAHNFSNDQWVSYLNSLQ